MTVFAELLRDGADGLAELGRVQVVPAQALELGPAVAEVARGRRVGLEEEPGVVVDDEERVAGGFQGGAEDVRVELGLVPGTAISVVNVGL